MRLMKALSLVVALCILVPQALHAAVSHRAEPLGNEPLANCSTCFDAATFHWFGTGSCDPAFSDCYDCTEFNSCHTDNQPGSCAEWHNHCGHGLLSAAVRRGIETRDAVALLAAAKTNPKFVKASGEYVLVLDCKGLVVSAIAVSQPKHVALLWRAVAGLLAV